VRRGRPRGRFAVSSVSSETTSSRVQMASLSHDITQSRIASMRRPHLELVSIVAVLAA
jgi:hypothetical protein